MHFAPAAELDRWIRSVLVLQEFGLQASSLGYIFTTTAVVSVLSGVFIIPWARAKYLPGGISTAVVVLLNLLLVLDGFSIWTGSILLGSPQSFARRAHHSGRPILTMAVSLSLSLKRPVELIHKQPNAGYGYLKLGNSILREIRR